VSDPEIMGGDTVFSGTRVPVHLIAELVAQGAAPTELLEGYPRLTAEMVRLRWFVGREVSSVARGSGIFS
jgi:uncharacterized protein (DUF433 family)